MREMGRDCLLVRAYSDIGIKNYPNHMHERNDGVYFGSDAILSHEYIQEIQRTGINTRVFEFKYTRNSQCDGDNIFDIFAKDTKALSKIIEENFNESERLIVVGGDNSIFLAVYIAVAKIYSGKSVGIIDFDTHGDIHLRKTSPSDNIHGMYLRPIFGKFDVPSVDGLVSSKLQGDDLMYFGNFDFEKEEIAFLDSINVKRFTKHDSRINREAVVETLQKFLSAHDHIIINFDIDVFDKTLVSATGIPSDNGLLETDVFPLLDIIRKHSSYTLCLSELNPEKEGSEKSEFMARSVIRAVL